MKIHQKKELQNINHSADIEYKDFMKVYRKCKKDSFLIIDTTLPAIIL